ncbi:MAG: isopenicillin N synthase family dioxygenase [Ilumatobacteraceae bacterium]
MTSIPTVSLGDAGPHVAGIVGAACRDVGFFQITDHGVGQGVIDRAWQTSRRFFDLPAAERLATARRRDGDAYGYIPLATEALTRSLDTGGDTAPDLKETFNVGPFERPAVLRDEGERWAFGDTPWPPSMPELRAALEPYHRAMLDLATRLMRVFAMALDLPPDWFDGLIDQSPSALRIIDYPHLESAALDRISDHQFRAGAHTDYGTLTLLVQDDAPGGLEVLDPRSGAWTPVPACDGAIVVNLGDLMARWTNERWRSTLHRVVTPPPSSKGSTRRQSIAFFHNANYHAVIECLPTCLGPGEQPSHPPVEAGPHLMSKFHRAIGRSPA